MSRRIITKQQQGITGPEALDGYFDRLLRYIPSDVIGLWLVGAGLIESLGHGEIRSITFVIYFAVCLVITAWWTWRQTSEVGKPPATTQIVISTIAFIIWVLAIKGPAINLKYQWYQPVWGSLLLLVYSVVVAQIVPKDK